MFNLLFRASHRVGFPFLALLIWLAACGAPQVPPTPTRYPSRTPRALAQPSKVARLAPTDTPIPTRTPRPTRTPIPTATDIPTNTAVPKARAPQAATAAATRNIPPTAAPTLTPANTATPPIPLAINADCPPSSGSQYGLLGAGGWEGRPPESHPDLNLAVRGYRMVKAFHGLVDYTGETDGNAPQLWGLFADRRTPVILHTYQVYDWDWSRNVRGDPIQDFDVTMVGFQVSKGETIFTPDFGHELGEGYVAIVLYADAHRLTLKYTGEDNVIDGYTLHLEGICVNTNLLNLYNERQAAGRGALPALRPGQPVGYVPGNELGVAIRDRGAFLDPRSRKDWWKGR